MRLKRRPPPTLLPFIQSVWLVDETFAPRPTAGREHVLPTGGMHLVFRISDHPVHLFSDFEDTAGRTFGCAVVGGPRAGFYMKDVSEPSYRYESNFVPEQRRCCLVRPPATLRDVTPDWTIFGPAQPIQCASKFSRRKPPSGGSKR